MKIRTKLRLTRWGTYVVMHHYRRAGKQIWRFAERAEAREHRVWLIKKDRERA